MTKIRTGHHHSQNGYSLPTEEKGVKKKLILLSWMNFLRKCWSRRYYWRDEIL